ncbi:MAG: ATP-grasp domain-containing protein [Acidobacteria bacterium]|nr:ATP-grasp domain-containing protein [Acidobacteriota bacterium]
MRRVLLIATTTGYQTRAFDEAAQRLGVDLTFATDRCAVLDDPWRDRAIPVRFHAPAAAVSRLSSIHRRAPFHGVVAVGDRPAALAARVSAALGLPGHPPEGAAAARSKRRTRERLRAAGLLTPAFRAVPLGVDGDALAASLPFPVVIKPVSLSGSRGVMRADDAGALRAALDRLRALLARPDIRAERDPAHAQILIESFIPGHEYALEGVMTNGRLQTLAIFDKPDPLDGPFFEETIYVTLPDPDGPLAQQISGAVASAAAAIGLRHGPVHAECRVNDAGVFVLEVAARPIGGICARSLRFVAEDHAGLIALEELLLRHALGEEVSRWRREAAASGVMMIPIPKRGFYRTVAGVEEARAVAGVEDVVITAKADQLLVPLPEGASYLGFIFARAATAAEVEQALRRAHARLAFTIAPEVPMLQSTHG